MKKYIIAALGFAALTINTNKANAQQGFSLSVKAIPQFSFLQNKDDNDNPAIDKKVTFDAGFGLGLGYNFTPKAGIGVDVLYSLQGQKYKSSGATLFNKVNYVKIPLYFSYTASPAKAVSFTGKIGPQVSLRTSAKITDGDGNDIVADKDDMYEGATFGAVAGAGVQFRLSQNLSLATLARFDYDFSNAEDKSYPGYRAGRAKTYNMTTGIEVGLKYAFK